MSKSSKPLPPPARAKPSSSSGRNSPTCSGENSVGSQPSAISAAERRVLRPDRGDVDRDPLLHRRDRQLQRLARARPGSGSSSVSPSNSTRSRASAIRTTSTYSRVRCSWLREALPVPALGHLRPAGADPEQHPPVRELVERRRGHRGHRRRAAGHLEDRRAELDRSVVRRRARRGSSRRRSRRPRRSTPSRSRAARPRSTSSSCSSAVSPRPQ